METNNSSKEVRIRVHHDEHAWLRRTYPSHGQSGNAVRNLLLILRRAIEEDNSMRGRILVEPKLLELKLKDRIDEEEIKQEFMKKTKRNG